MHVTPSFRYEQPYWEAGVRLVAGVDEVGMGALAGPVVAAAVIFSSGVTLHSIRDSKTLSPKKREALVDYITSHAMSWGIGEATVEEIDRHTIRGAVGLAMQRAMEQLSPGPEVVLIDGNYVPPGLVAMTECIVKGDAASWSIAAASVLAKVHRDTLMGILHEQYPQYGFATHKGYGTAEHMRALETYGASPSHRRSYAPVAAVLTSLV